MEVIAFLVGATIGSLLTAFFGRPRTLRAIEKDLSESYRGETFERRAKRASK